MSADEDTELRDLVAQTLEANGVLGKIRAQLRASVFLALEEQESIQNKGKFTNPNLKSFLATKEGRVVAGLVREFLEHFNLEFSAAVFEPETGAGEHYEGRNSLARDLDILESDSTNKQPLLAEVVKRSYGGQTQRGRSGSGTEDLSSSHIREARTKFDEYDIDNSGTIEKDELRALFCDMFPGFHKNMLDRYVNDEFRAIDTDFSNSIDFEEFLTMYKRLFVLCKSVVSHDVSDLTMPSPRGRVNSNSDVLPPSKIPAPRIKQDDFMDESSSSSSSTSSLGVDSKNKRNLDSDRSQGSRTSPRSPSSPVSKKEVNIYSDFDNDDAFFDDPVPKNENNTFSSTSRNRSKSGSSSPGNSPRPSQIPKWMPSSDKSKKDSGGMSSLGGLPPLNGPAPDSHKMNSTNGNEIEKDIKAIDKKIADLGFAKKYRIATKTGSKWGAGTDANVFVTLFGDAGRSTELKLDSVKKSFERGRKDQFFIESTSVGTLKRIRISHDNKGGLAGWYLEKVEVEDLSDNHIYDFPCDRWLAVNEDDGAISRDLVVDVGPVDVPNDEDYDDDDFESSNVSPYGITPRSQKSDANVKSIDEDIVEDIEEELSVAEDLLKSDHSGMDDLTTDRTVSPVDHSSAFDYMEEVTLP